MRLVAAVCAVVLMAAVFDSEASSRRSGLTRGSSSGARHHHHHHARVLFVPAFWTSPRPYYYPAPVTQYWYYCQGAAAYYPYVQDCPGGWEPVIPSMPAR